MTAVKTFVLRLVRDEQGQDLIEYALLAALVSIVAIVIIGTLGTTINSFYSKINSNVSSAGAS